MEVVEQQRVAHEANAGVKAANWLAAVGFLSFSTVPREGRIAAAGPVYDGAWNFVGPIWNVPLSRACIEAPRRFEGSPRKVRPLGVAGILRARRVANGKYMNVSRARPFQA